MGQGNRLSADQGAVGFPTTTASRCASNMQWHDEAGRWFRAYGNEQWKFASDGLMRRREASINDVPITAEQRKFLWPAGPRPLRSSLA